MAGPTALIIIILSWVALMTVGWALVYWPYLPENFLFSTGLNPALHGGFVDALYVSFVTLVTLGYGDITPTENLLRSLFATSILFCKLLLLPSGCEEASNSEGSESESPPAPGIVSERPGERVSVDDDTFTRLSPIKLRNIKKKEKFLLVNVRVPLAGNIPGTEFSIPYNEIK